MNLTGLKVTFALWLSTDSFIHERSGLGKKWEDVGGFCAHAVLAPPGRSPQAAL